jgi:hypothetical protein
MRSRSGGLVGNEATSQYTLPGSEGIMNSYSKIMGEQGFDPLNEQEDAQRKIFNDFMQKAKGGQIQGRGRFSGKYEPTAIGFQKYLAGDAAYQLDQGKGGRAYDEKIKNINWNMI